MIVGAAGPYAASPTPTKHLVASKSRKLGAKPEPPLARLHKATPTPINSQRDMRSANQPKSGASSMYESMKAVCSHPNWASAALSAADIPTIHVEAAAREPGPG